MDQTLFTWDGNRLIEQSRTDTCFVGPVVSTWEYLPGSWRPITQTVEQSAGDLEFYAVISDLIGTPTELMTPDGARVAWTNDDRTVWGAPAVRGAESAKNSAGLSRHGIACPLRFPGQYADDETGLHYNRHRYYDPASARYTTADPLGLAPAPDPHSYVLNPTGWADPLGLGPCDPAGLLGDEANGGHTIARHVGRSENYLRSRNIPEASTFSDLAIASTETAANLNRNSGAIRFWLRNINARSIVIGGPLTKGAGITYLRHSGVTVQASRITTNLWRDANASGGYRIRTSYPEP